MEIMEYINWNAEYSIDAGEIDNQHKEIMTLINYSLRNCTKNKLLENEFFRKRIQSMIEFALKHINTEEEILSKTNYKKLEEHKAEHQKIIEKIMRTKEELEKDGKEFDLLEKTQYVKEWFLTHIMLYDKEAKEYLKEGKK